MADALPDRNSSEIFLVVATPEEIIAQQHANSEEWRGALTLPAYLRREELLVDQTLTKDGGLTAWSLVYQPAGSDEKDRQVLCGCETIKKRALVASGNTVEAVTAHWRLQRVLPAEAQRQGLCWSDDGRSGREAEDLAVYWPEQSVQRSVFRYWQGEIIHGISLHRLDLGSSPCRSFTPHEDGKPSHRPTSRSMLGLKVPPVFPM